MRLSDDSIRGRNIIAADGQIIGEIGAIFVDTGTWQVESIQARLRKDVADRLGSGRSVFRAGVLEIPVRMIQSTGDTVVLSVPLNDLRQLVPSQTEEATPGH